MTNEAVTVKNNKIDKLEAMLFHLLESYDRYAQERQLLNKEREALINLSASLANQIKDVEKLGVTQQKNCALIEKAISKVEQQYILIETRMNKAHPEKKRFSWKAIILTLISSACISFLLTWILFSKPAPSLTGEQRNYLRDGQSLAKIWPELTDAERKHLKNIANKVMHKGGLVY